MTLETAPTEFAEAAKARFAYRKLGLRDGTPLICLQHFSGTMDAWDPAVVNALAQGRPVIVFDNKGLGKSSGATPDNVAQMAADAESFVSALDITTVDLLGYYPAVRPSADRAPDVRRAPAALVSDIGASGDARPPGRRPVSAPG